MGARNSKIIKWNDIVNIDKNNNSILTCKIWGQSLTPIWWALDCDRLYNKNHYTFYISTKINHGYFSPKSGFSCLDGNKVYKIILSKIMPRK